MTGIPDLMAMLNAGDCWCGRSPEDLWFARGREATRADVLASISSGLHILRETAEQDGPEAVAELEAPHARALGLMPRG